SILDIIEAGIFPLHNRSINLYNNVSDYSIGRLFGTLSAGAYGYRAFIDGTGPYIGSGRLTSPDVHWISEQSAARAKGLRISGIAGLLTYHHDYDHRVIDVEPGLRIFPSKFTQLGVQEYTGLGDEI